MTYKNKLAVVAWWFYDWANSAFVLTVMTAFFPVLFKSYWCANVDATVSTARLGIGNAVAGLVVAVLSLLLGALADAGGGKKKFLLFFLLIGVLSTFFLSGIPGNRWFLALFFFLSASIGFNGGNVFYDSLLVNVADRNRMDWVSAVGYSTGYIGSGLLFVMNVFMVSNPSKFGLTGMVPAVKTAFLIAAIWWLLFSLPLFVFVREHKRKTVKKTGIMIRESLIRIISTAVAIVKNKRMCWFLIAYWVYIDGVHTFIVMAIDFGMSVGLNTSSLMIVLIIVQFIGFPSTLLFGLGAKKFGAYTMIATGIIIYFLVCSIGSFLVDSITGFMILACLIACAQGGIQSLSRSVFGKMVPIENATEYFGFFNIVNRFAVIIGPMAVGSVGLIAKKAGYASETASRLGMSSVSFLFIVGGLLLVYTVKIKDTIAHDR